MMFLEEVAAEMLTLTPAITRMWTEAARSYGVAVWISRLYGYDVVIRQGSRDDPYRGMTSYFYEAVYTRVDEPGARRRAEWMRNPAGDPAYPPPVTWHVNGGFGFHPPGWHPAVRLVVTPEVERTVRFHEDEFNRMRHENGMAKFLIRTGPRADLPPAPPPPPPPDTIAYPDEHRPR